MTAADQAANSQLTAERRGGGRNGGRRARAMFGDVAAVRSDPIWSGVALVALIVVWWLTTRTWGFPQAFKDAAEAAAAAEGRTLTQADLVAACQLAEDCSDDDYTQILNPRRFPSPRDTWLGFNELRTDGFKNITLWEHTWTSLWRVIRGMFFGTVFGVPIGFAMGLSSKLRGLFDTPVELFRPIPPLAILPLFLLWFGIGDPSSVRLLIFASIWIMIIASRAGVQTVNLSKVRAAYSLGASRWQILRRVILPNALPEIFTGVRIALGVSWGTLVAAELVGTDTGLGAMIFQARAFFRVDVMVVGIIIIAVIGVLMDLLMRVLEDRLVPWRGKS